MSPFSGLPSGISFLVQGWLSKRVAAFVQIGMLYVEYHALSVHSVSSKAILVHIQNLCFFLSALSL